MRKEKKMNKANKLDFVCASVSALCRLASCLATFGPGINCESVWIWIVPRHWILYSRLAHISLRWSVADIVAVCVRATASIEWSQAEG